MNANNIQLMTGVLKICAAYFVNLAQGRVTWEDGTSTEEIPLPHWSVLIFMKAL